MKLYYFQIEEGNFGDDMNLWFWHKLIPNYESISRDTTLFGIGSILNDANLRPFNKVLVLGSGSAYGNLTTPLSSNIKIGWVRGPRTALRLGLNPDQSITDPACLVSKILVAGKSTGDDKIFIPHIGTSRLPVNWRKICSNAGLRYVSPSGDSLEVVRQISRAKLVVTESLHGAIVSDAYRVPWVPVSIAPNFNTFKWNDWAESMDIQNFSALNCLSSMKVAFEFLQVVKKGFRRSTGFGGGKNTTQQTSIMAVDKSYSPEVKENSKILIKNFPIVFEKSIERDLRRASREKPMLSSDKVLMSRQESLGNRIDLVVNDFLEEN